MILAYIGLGANLGDAQATVLQAASELSQTPGVSQLKLSKLYRTAPIDAGGPHYINAVAAIQTNLTAQALLAVLQNIEHGHGRLRPYRNAPRTLDLDLLLYGSSTIDQADLTVPHPRMHQRAFVLKPLSDLAADLQLPQGSLKDLLAACSDQAIERLPD
ncbi:2-amino-4-hydroxy-6-hydroxymethyldihydropteridine diphosphokinase [Paralcaligenes ureilyticus]|uniref:2-amino-4-hydroxy-6-hydroxymethyldihydropteridine pyrophosphokinase n=1 Tax=Paralcaligenes ureilyticus TaxID=627131 RepID=A0A4R3MBX5_9BURK|nr:2-amino-4-hydroxy-6-hydroxymethyldihydropteridine diphosphokinase [Paralcaligenes ureilyticus]TCT09457.1 2-amino-4-hydroxy-6-hydroxymethyldihydropteridine diphosphokinase [Paralcaligenes ureilyticus]